MLADRPSQDVKGLLQGSAVGEVETGFEVIVGITVGETTINSPVVSDETGVSLGSGVGTGVSVGGMGVFVGIAACVLATTVDAIATAVDCTSFALKDGSAEALVHALSKRLRMARPAQVFCFIGIGIPQ